MSSRRHSSGIAALNRILQDPSVRIANDPPPPGSSIHLLPALDYEPMRHPEWVVIRSADGVGVTIKQASSSITIAPAELPALIAKLYKLAS
jgi:hypothetical protein